MFQMRYSFPNVKILYQTGKQGNDTQRFSLNTIQAFLNDCLNRDNLQIGDYLPRMGYMPFFLVAATGLGKTVGVPPHVFLKQCELAYKDDKPGDEIDQVPQIWVVVPKIPIALEQMEYMNRMFKAFVHRPEYADRRTNPVLFGAITSTSGQVNPHAPIMFVTTGIFTLFAKNDRFLKLRDRIIIDEAHVTIEQQEDMELAIAICRQKGIVVDYMSATVDTGNIRQALGVTNIIEADRQHHPIWYH